MAAPPPGSYPRRTEVGHGSGSRSTIRIETSSGRIAGGVLEDAVTETDGRKKGQPLLFLGMVAVVASAILRRYDLDFLSGVCLGISLASFFLGFRAFYRR
jgi:hypothetical protein